MEVSKRRVWTSKKEETGKKIEIEGQTPLKHCHTHTQKHKRNTFLITTLEIIYRMQI